MKRTLALLAAVVFTGAGGIGAAQGPGRGPAAPPRPDNPQSLMHVDAARTLAGSDAWLQAPFTFYCVAGNARGNSPAAPELEPVKLFDNVYAVGNSEATVYAIVTPQGIILIDSGYADRVETVVVAGLKTRGARPGEREVRAARARPRRPLRRRAGTSRSTTARKSVRRRPIGI